MKLYLAAAFERQLEMSLYKRQLTAFGHEVVSRWHDPAERHRSLADATTIVELERWASEDVTGVKAAEVVASFTGHGTRGGRHVELGIAIGLGKQLLIIGPKENVFHYLPGIEHFMTPDEFLKWAECG